METRKYHVKITFITPVLGTQPQKDVASEYIGKKFEENGGALPSDELETLDESMEKGTTAFHKLDGQPIIYDYVVKGFLKEVGRIFNGLHGVKALRSKIDNYVFVSPRRIELHMPEGSKIEFLERSLRAETAQGPRIGLARSEMLPEGTWFECDLEVFDDSPITEDIIRDLFSYAEKKGFLQWRNGGWGRAVFEMR